jgi:hypothetical protein
MSQDLPEGASDDRQPGDTLDGQSAPTADVVFGTLARATNRYVLQYLIECDRRASVDELVEYAVTAAGTGPDETVGEFRGSVRASVERSVAELESRGFLRYDRGTRTVEPTDSTDVVEPHLALALEDLPRE